MCVTQWIYAYIACFVWRHIGHTIVWNYAFCIIFEWYFVLVFCLCFVYNYNIIFLPLWDQYTDSIVPLPMCLFGAVSDNLSSQSSVNKTFKMLCTWDSQWRHWWHLFTINQGQKLDSAEWQSYIWDTWTTRKEWWVSENILWQEFVRYGTHFR